MFSTSSKKFMFSMLLITFFFTVCFAKVTYATDENIPMIINCNEPFEITRWRITNDSVMGGLSSGRFYIEDNEKNNENGCHGLFTGTISRENNGGFSSVYRPIEALTNGVNKVAINVSGDGERYQFRIIANVDGYRLAYQHEFLSSSEGYKQFQLKFIDFKATFRGRLLPNAPVLVAEKIKEVGFLITKKNAGAFRLAIADIEFK